MESKHRQTIGRRAKLFRNGRSQYLRIPRGWQLRGSEAVIRKDGERLIVMPASKNTLLAVLRQLGPLPETDRMPPIDDFPPDASRP